MNILSILMAAVIIAHRGGALLGTENSLSCIEKGIATGAQMVEVDLHLTSDRHIVVCHDQSVNRTTNGRGKIEQMTLEQVQSLRLLRRDGSVSDEAIPTLEQVLEVCHGRCSLLLEIKKWRADQYSGIEAIADSIVKAYGMQNEVVFQSFNDRVLTALHDIDPSLRLEKLLVAKIGHLIIDNGLSWFTWDKYTHIASFNIHRLFASRRFIDIMHRHGKQVKIWTIERPDQIKDASSVDGIITDRPDLF